MAVAIRRNQPRSVQPTAWVHRRGAEPDAVLAALMVALVLAGVGVLAVALTGAPAPASRTEWFRLLRGNPPPPREGAAPMLRVLADTRGDPVPAGPSAASMEATPTPEPPAPGPGLAVGGAARVAHTDGLGVVLHAAPSRDARMPAGLLEGSRVTVLELPGTEWARVQADTRRTGWVPAAFLIPDDGD